MKKRTGVVGVGVIAAGAVVTAGVMGAGGNREVPLLPAKRVEAVRGAAASGARAKPGAAATPIAADPTRGFQALVASYGTMSDPELDENRRRVQNEIDSRGLVGKANKAELSGIEAQDLAVLLQKADALSVVHVQRLLQNVE